MNDKQVKEITSRDVDFAKWYTDVVKKADFVLSREVDKAEWVNLGQALDKLREGSIAWQLVNEVIKSEHLK